jgi:hypothetical protein
MASSSQRDHAATADGRGVTFAMSLYCNSGDSLYTLAGIRRARMLREHFPQCSIRFYVDNSVPTSFIAAVKQHDVHAVFVKHAIRNRGFMTLLRFLAYDTVPSGIVVSLDLHDHPKHDAQLAAFLKQFQSMSSSVKFAGRTWRCARETMSNAVDRLQNNKPLRVPLTMHYATRMLAQYPATKDTLACLDADGFAVRRTSSSEPVKIRSLLEQASHDYQYADDELVLLQWMEQQNIRVLPKASDSFHCWARRPIEDRYLDVSEEPDLESTTADEAASCKLADEVIEWSPKAS